MPNDYKTFGLLADLLKNVYPEKAQHKRLNLLLPFNLLESKNDSALRNGAEKKLTFANKIKTRCNKLNIPPEQYEKYFQNPVEYLLDRHAQDRQEDGNKNPFLGIFDNEETARVFFLGEDWRTDTEHRLSQLSERLEKALNDDCRLLGIDGAAEQNRARALALKALVKDGLESMALHSQSNRILDLIFCWILGNDDSPYWAAETQLGNSPLAPENEINSDDYDLVLNVYSGSFQHPIGYIAIDCREQNVIGFGRDFTKGATINETMLSMSGANFYSADGVIDMPTAAVVPQDDGRIAIRSHVSRRHAILSRDDKHNSWVLHDLYSSNGTLVKRRGGICIVYSGTSNDKRDIAPNPNENGALFGGFNCGSATIREGDVIWLAFQLSESGPVPYPDTLILNVLKSGNERDEERG